jgi:hypothetical protein
MTTLIRTAGLATIVAILLALCPSRVAAQDSDRRGAERGEAPAAQDDRLFAIIDSVSASRIEADIRALAGFGTRSTLSDTASTTRGIGAARRWIKDEFERISAACGACLEVRYQRTMVLAAENRRIPADVEVVNVIAILRGETHPDSYVIMSGDIDSRPSDGSDGTSDSPGANDNASGMAGVIEAARVLSQYRFGHTLVFAGLSGEEQGLFGGAHMAEEARTAGWHIVAALNNDMIGNIEGLDGVIDNTTFRVFSEPVTPFDADAMRNVRFFGGEVDGTSRQIARYVDRLVDRYFTNLDAMMIYRLDRFGRGGHHRPFNDVGFPGVRIMEAHENYTRQHQDIRVEDGIEYGDVISGVNFGYAAKLTGVNAITMASLAWAPPAPVDVRIGGAVRPSTRLAWTKVDDPGVIGYIVHWRPTTEAQWTNARFVGDVDQFTFENVVIDNYLFGVSSVNAGGHQSPVVFPGGTIR